MLVSILSVYGDPCEMSWAEAALALAPLCGYLNLEDLLKNGTIPESSCASPSFLWEFGQTWTGFLKFIQSLSL